ncbi:hypothetical protein [Lacipirellula sp.]|uniref:hypothetical protein n=1 Tax=Lacipirellula sp. TaxID=2691419 RepID=UPI003D12F712
MRTRVAASLAMLCLLAVGCRSAMNCSEGCACPSGSPLAGMRYCEPGCAPYAAKTPACGESCAAGCTDACGEGCSGCSKCAAKGLSGCTGCGERYWCDWYNHPPQLCEPCDCHGNYTGPGVDRYILPNASGRAGTPVGTETSWPH